MRRWFVILASVAILLGLARAAGFRQVLDVWRTVEPRGILLSVLCYFAAAAVRVLLWRRLLGADAPPFAALAPPLAAGFVLGHVTPAKAGEPAASLLVSRAFGLPLARTLAVLAAERAVQLLALLATFAPAAVLAAGGSLRIRGTTVAALLLLAALAAAFALLPRALPRLAARAAGLPHVGRVFADFVSALADLARRRELLPSLGALAVLYWSLQYASLWAILDAGGANVNLLEAAAVAGAAILGGTLSMLPLGTQDGISAVALAGLGVPLARGFALALFHTLLSLACGMTLALALPLLPERRA
ncbi:MAG: lysylphosphatidylglycerol synthase domain-containing protein [Candidatus Eiseniibacteriota bacterium]